MNKRASLSIRRAVSGLEKNGTIKDAESKKKAIKAFKRQYKLTPSNLRANFKLGLDGITENSQDDLNKLN